MYDVQSGTKYEKIQPASTAYPFIFYFGYKFQIIQKTYQVPGTYQVFLKKIIIQKSWRDGKNEQLKKVLSADSCGCCAHSSLDLNYH